LPFQPNVQFTPLYVALANGYYRDAGLDVKFEYGDESEQVRLAASGAVPAAIAGGDQVILARAAGIPATYVMTWFHRLPLAVFGLDPSMKTAADLKGKKVGLPDNSGTSYLGWQAFLLANGIDPQDVTTEIIGYTQREAVANGLVDAAVGYVNNEPLQLTAEGKQVSVIDIADTANLVSNGLVVGQSTIDEDPALVQALVTATLRGIAATLDDPDAAFEETLKQMPIADPAVRAIQRQVLEASLPLWTSAQLGAIDKDAWAKSQATMHTLGLIDKETPVDTLTDDQFVAAAKLDPQP
jgi:NitT/TauT family transport system substrate-binding protein